MPTVLEHSVSFYKKVKDIESQDTIPFDIFLENIRTGQYEDIVHKVRTEPDKKKRAELKEKYAPSVTVAGIFGTRKDDSLVKPSSLIAIDIDEDGFPDSASDPEELKSLVCPDRFIGAAFTTISGRGLCLIMRINAGKHREHFQAIGEYLFSSYGIIIDPTSINVSRPRFVSYDPHIYIAKSFDRFTALPKEKEPKKIDIAIYSQDDFSRIISQIQSENVNITQDSYQVWLKLGFAVASKFGESGRQFFHAISAPSVKYDSRKTDKQYNNCIKHDAGFSGHKAGISTFYWYAKKAGIDIYSERTKKIAYTTAQNKKAGLKPAQIADNLKKHEGITGAEDIIKQVFEQDIWINEDTLLDQLELWIRQNYNLRRNLITKYIERDGQPLEQEDLNSIFIRAKKLYPELPYDLMDRLINSDFIAAYNPILAWFAAHTTIAGEHVSTRFKHGSTVPQPNTALGAEAREGTVPELTNDSTERPETPTVFSPTPTIDLFFSCITTRDPDYLLYFGKKWMVSAISALYGEHSPLMLVLSGDVQNTGKTEHFRRMLPAELKKFYAESKLDAGKDDEILMTQKWFIMDDEMGGKSKKEVKRLKELTSKQVFSLRKPYGRGNVDIIRLAVLCGTTNDNEILSDPTGNRRLIPIHVFSIDHKTYNKLDKVELWLEAYRLYHEGFNFQLNREDIAYLNQQSEHFEVTVGESELISRFFITGQVPMTATDIKVYIEQKTNQRLSLDRIAKELKRLKFEQKHVRTGLTTRRVYMVETVTEQTQQTYNWGSAVPPERNDDDKPF